MLRRNRAHNGIGAGLVKIRQDEFSARTECAATDGDGPAAIQQKAPPGDQLERSEDVCLGFHAAVPLP